MDKNHQDLCDLLGPVIAEIAKATWDDTLATQLNVEFGPDSELFGALKAICDKGIQSGWMGLQGEEARKGARVIEPCAATNGMSIDVVQLINFTGPHHRHPNGEVCAVMSDSAEGRFDGNPEGWAVYPPNSVHWPQGSGGRIRILFFLPDGAIEYTDREASLVSGERGAGG